MNNNFSFHHRLELMRRCFQCYRDIVSENLKSETLSRNLFYVYLAIRPQAGGELETETRPREGDEIWK